ncbi:hypothetical protein GGX14DRAFT_348856 [Mycena pura]|uniref:Ditrans,polycis-polyprenyl diphosphate synthase ((2E,6E)-farnesyl diphosphate specific) n=1 Tax=Mycena pura TaxID=153505 RepID=A0AAD6YPD1_9AGAR|nr:hypothetical protein GGX14DRAFT_348856 [Mycena pura]
MELLLCVLLRVVHWTNSIITLLTACWRSFRSTPPLPLRTTRRVIPRHLALLLVPDCVCDAAVTRKCLLESVRRTAGWCRVVGIEKLTVYDSQGLLVECADEIVSSTSEPAGYDSSSGSDMDYPLTPPASDCSDSWPLSPGGDLHKDTSAINMRLIGSARKRSSRYGLQMRNHDSEHCPVN